MVNLKLKQFQAGFFDRKGVESKVGKAARRVLSRFGAFVRQRARTSIRKKKGSSRPGRPPHSQLGHLRRFIFFAYDDRREVVVIGPALLNGTKSRGKALPLLEFGGTAQGDGRTVFLSRDPGRDRRGRFVSQGREAVTLSGTLKYPARPFMGPALDAERPKLAPMWRNSIR